ncbi:MAG: exonuclease domain-containing protein [Deltaproteobacteria bacterium]
MLELGTDLTFFDTETTGLDPLSGDRIIELAAVRVRNGSKVGSFQTLVDPERPVSYGAFRVNGISDEMLSGQPRMAAVLPQFEEFFRGSCLCSYNAPFDMGFLANEYRLAGREFPEDLPVVDVLSMARHLLRDIERHALWFVAESLGIEKSQEHRALSDVELTVEVFGLLSARLDGAQVRSLNDMVSLFGRGCCLFDQMQQRKIAQIQRAIDLGAKVKIRYFSRSDAKVTEREVIPGEIRTDRNRTYFTGFCCMKNSERTFRIEGILDLEMLGKATEGNAA